MTAQTNGVDVLAVPMVLPRCAQHGEMNGEVVQLHSVAPRADRAWAAFTAVYLAAKRFGHAHRASLNAARAARAGVLCGRTSAAAAISNLKQDLRASAGSRP